MRRLLRLLLRQLLLPLLSQRLLLVTRTSIRIWRFASGFQLWRIMPGSAMMAIIYALSSSFLHGKRRSYFQSKYDAYKAANGGAEPVNPREFFRETMISGYSLSDQTQVYWDNWNNLRMLANMDIGDYNNAFTQCLTSLGD
jgi:hypothetical protein